jgi:hypothetical protein
VFRGEGPLPRPLVTPRMLREIARKEREVTEVLADAGARDLVRSGWRDTLGHDCKDVMKGLVLRFQADGRQPPFAALQEFAQSIANKDERLPALLDEAQEQEG